MCAYHSAAPSSSPKHTIYYTFFMLSICAIFVIRKEQKEAGFGPYLLKIMWALSRAADATVSHAALFTIALPFLLFLWLLCIVYALLIFPARIFFSETYLHDDDDGVVNEKSISPSDWVN